MYVEVFDQYKCYHSSCGCLVTNAGDFCGDGCKQAQNSGEKCQCGHEGCKTELPRDTASTHIMV